MGFKITKLVSGGQTGADRAALDFAIAHGIRHGGWCPKGRKAEDDSIPDRYQLQETPRGDYVQRTEWNVRDSDGTVVFSIEPTLTGGSQKTVELARKHGKPCLHLSAQSDGDKAPRLLREFIEQHGIRVLNVAGPRASKEPDVAMFVTTILKKALFCQAKKLEPPDSLHLQAAQGWLELGSHLEANEELERIEAKNRAHPDVLQVRWNVYAKAEKWDACLDLAIALTRIAPDRAVGYINRSASLCRLGRLREAWDILLPVAPNFPENAMLHYDLARYACQLGLLDEARAWLDMTFDNDGSFKVKALEDPTLEPMWREIGTLGA